MRIEKRMFRFFENVPDENLVSYIQKREFLKGKVLELGCGPGRNAIYLANEGFDVTAVDLSVEGINWAKRKGIGKRGRNSFYL